MNANIVVLLEVLKEDQIPYIILSPTGNFVQVTERPFFFLNTTTPCNSDVHGLICKDKSYQQLLFEGGIFPKTKTYLDPYVASQYKEYVEFPRIEDIITDIHEHFLLPCIIKANRLSGGRQVFLCHSREEVSHALCEIFANTKHYDYIALAQQYIVPKKEYRIVWLKDSISIMYEKNNQGAIFVGNVSPLHWEGARAIDTSEDSSIWNKASSLCEIVAKKTGLMYFGLDIIEDMQGELWLIELNGAPGFSIYIRDCGDKKVRDLYRHMIQMLIFK